MGAISTRRHYRFQQIDIDLANLRVTVNGQVRPLEPKSFRLLQFLIENRGRAVPKDEILNAVWADAFVTDNALTRAVAQIRKALDDDSKQPRYIETVPTIGYRFLPEFETIDEENGEHPAVRAKQPTAWVMVAVASIVIILAGGWWLSRLTSLANSSGTHAAQTLTDTAQLTTSHGLDVDAAWSPDGSMIAYSSDRSGSFEIYLRSRDAAAQELRLTSDGNQNLTPSFSPDGRSVTYSSLAKPGIFRVPTLGGSVQRLTDFGAQPKWSPDGQWIVFVSDPKPSMATTDYYFGATSTLNLVAATGGAVKQLTSATFEGGQTFPSWSADAQEIRFVNYVGMAPSLWTYRMSDGKLERRFGGDLGTTFGDAVFSHDSTRMYYIRSQLNGDIEIWMQALDPKTLKPSRPPEPLFQPSLGVPRGLALSPDGKRMAFSATLAESKVMMRKMRGDSIDEAPAEEVTHETSYRYSIPMWSPDSKSVLYTKFAKGRAPQTWLHKLDGSSPRMVGQGIRPQLYPLFTPDGKSILVDTFSGEKQSTLDQISLTDGALRERAKAGRRAHPSLSPDGDSIVYHDPAEAVLHLYREDLKTGVRTQLTSGDQSTGYPHFSRDGKLIDFEINLRSRDQLGMVAAAGGPVRVFWDEPGRWFAAGWMPSGDRVLAAGNRGGGWALYTIDVNSKQAQQLTKELPLRMYLRYPDISPDGKRIVYEFNESRGNVFVGVLP